MSSDAPPAASSVIPCDARISATAGGEDVAIQVRNISKCYQIYDKPHDRLKQSIYPRLQKLMGRRPQQYHRNFWALKDVSFEIRRGETVGIIGRNGSGKSTLLQIICGTLSPTSGTVALNGRVAALLELGSGFNPDFTGRENVYMNGMLLGLTPQEVDARFDEIAAFADIGAFIDQPVKTYSSGMFVRLAFAVIAHADADILVIDEALAVGDAFFTQKCMRFIRRFQQNGGTIIFVSHDMAAVTSICQSAVMLFPGAAREVVTGPAETLCKNYLNQLYDDPARLQRVVSQGHDSDATETADFALIEGSAAEQNVYAVSEFRSDAEAFGLGGAVIIDAGFYDDDGKRLATVAGGDLVQFVISARAKQRIAHPALGLMIKDRLGQYVYTEGTDHAFREYGLMLEAGEGVDAIFRFIMPTLIRGVYTMNVAIAEGLGHDHVQHHWLHDAVRIESVSGPLVHGIAGFAGVSIKMRRYPALSEVTA